MHHHKGKGLKALVEALGLIGCVSTIGCASIQLPADQVASFDASVLAAKQIGVEHLSGDQGHRGGLGMAPAKEHLVLAREQEEVAKEMAAAGDRRAVYFLARAQSDVDLAVGLAREANGRAALASAGGDCPAGSCDAQSASPPAPIWTAAR
jgi:hypothetical protein